MRFALACGLLSFALAVPAWAQSAATAPAPPSTSEATNLQAVTVSGVQPGPGLWKVGKGGHVLWVLGVMEPLPDRMQWQSQEVDQVIAQSQQVLQLPKLKFKVDTSFFGKLFLLPSAYGARKNDDGKTLQQILPAPLYAHWQTLKQQYLGNDRGIERWRPIFAGLQLYKKALKKNDLRNADQIKSAIDALAKQHGVEETPVQYLFEIKQPREAIKSFKSSGLDDIDCFSRTLDAIDHDIPNMAARANAWATGDLETLRKLPDSNQRDACVAAVTEADFARKLGMSDVQTRLRDTWLAAARAALASHAQTFALLPMGELLAADGPLGQLKAEGYTVASPEDDEDEAAPAASASSAAAAH